MSNLRFASFVMGSLMRRGYSKFVHEPVSNLMGNEVTQPWMHYIEVEIIKEIIKVCRPRRCLEWGCGYSTLYFPKFLSKDAQWISVEHNEQWANRVKKLNKNKNVTVNFVKANQYPWHDENHDGSYQDLMDYVNFPDASKPYDLILIDGRARADCLVKAKGLVSERGVIILHDAERQHYHAPLRTFTYQKYFQDGQGIWIGSDGVDIERNVDFEKFASLWKAHKRLSSIQH